MLSNNEAVEVTGSAGLDRTPGPSPPSPERRQYLKDLSDGCKTVVLKAVNVKACATDVKQFCADAQPSELEACIKAHVADLSNACKVAMANHAAGED